MGLLLDKKQISTLVNRFVKNGLEMGFPMEGMKIALFHEDNHWDLLAVPKRSPELKKAELHFNFPDDLPSESLDIAIELAGFLSVRLNSYISKKSLVLARRQSKGKPRLRKPLRHAGRSIGQKRQNRRKEIAVKQFRFVVAR